MELICARCADLVVHALGSGLVRDENSSFPSRGAISNVTVVVVVCRVTINCALFVPPH